MSVTNWQTLQALLIGIDPFARVEHRAGVLTGRFRDSHRLAPHRLAGLADYTGTEGGGLIQIPVSRDIGRQPLDIGALVLCSQHR
jgi:hypothetical protein